MDIDLSMLVSFAPLQELVKSLARQQKQQAAHIEKVETKLQESREANEALHQRLQEVLDTKATEEAVAALALEMSKDRGTTEKAVGKFEAAVEKRLDNAEARVEELQGLLADAKRQIESKCDTHALEALDTRVGRCTTHEELSATKEELVTMLAQSQSTATQAVDGLQADAKRSAERLSSLESAAKTFEAKEEAASKHATLEAALQQQQEGADARYKATLSKLGDMSGRGDERHAQLVEQAETHWRHIQKLQEVQATKANLEWCQEQNTAIRESVAEQAEEAALSLAELRRDVEARLDEAERGLQAHGAQLDELADEMLAKAALTETHELRERLAECALREETREMVEALRHESTSRLKMLKERIDYTDRELLRQLEESHSTDNADRYDALLAAIDAKADKEVAERWLESSMHLQMEMQTLHVRTQTLGQGLKVCLGWVEGMADRITGLDAAERRLERSVERVKSDAERHAQQVGNPQEWMAHFRNILAQQAALAQQTPPQHAACGSFAPGSKRNKDGSTAPGQRLGGGAGGADGGGASPRATTPPATDWHGERCAATGGAAPPPVPLPPPPPPPPPSRPQTAGAGGVCSGGGVDGAPMAGMVGLGGYGGGHSPRAPPGAQPRPSTAPRHEGDLRKRQLATKRKELVESRLRASMGTGVAAAPPPGAAAPSPRPGANAPDTRPPSGAADHVYGDARAIAETHVGFAQALTPRPR